MTGSSQTIYAIVKLSIDGKKRQFKKSLDTADVREARQRLAEFRLSLSQRDAEPSRLAPLIPAQKPIASPLVELTVAQTGERWLATQTDLAESTRRRRA